MWPFTRAKVTPIELAPPRPPVPPPPPPEPIDPAYIKSEYQLEDTGEGTYYIRKRDPLSSTWKYLDWHSTREYYPRWFDHHEAYFGAGVFKSNMRLTEMHARQWAKRDAQHHYQVWKMKQKAGAIIDLGKLP